MHQPTLNTRPAGPGKKHKRKKEVNRAAKTLVWISSAYPLSFGVSPPPDRRPRLLEGRGGSPRTCWRRAGPVLTSARRLARDSTRNGDLDVQGRSRKRWAFRASAPESRSKGETEEWSPWTLGGE